MSEEEKREAFERTKQHAIEIINACVAKLDALIFIHNLTHREKIIIKRIRNSDEKMENLDYDDVCFEEPWLDD